MTDSDALRARRSRMHRAGDHSMCVYGRCPWVRADIRPLPPSDVDEDEAPMPITESVQAFLRSAGRFDHSDPRSVAGELALLLARRLDTGDGAPAPLVNQMRGLLVLIGDPYAVPGDQILQLKLRMHQREIDEVINDTVDRLPPAPAQGWDHSHNDTPEWTDDRG